ncbi:DUF2786 domain-containing protein [Nocardia sp. NPDC059228]|uniref:DUF2786 domain-containing protein n=1 Tax=Nocardia sp. NPDC059228 TaxID=3346777 RepID=UPI0036C58672
MTPDQARIKVDKLRAHAASVAGTPEADLFHAKADELARQYGLLGAPLTSRTPHSAAAPSVSTTRPRSASTTPKRTTMTNTNAKTKPRRPASDGTLRNAFTPRTRAAFGRNAKPGTEVTGYIVAMEEEPELDFHTKALKLNADGTERMVPILILQTDGTTKPYGAGLRKLWVRSGIAAALIEACFDAGATAPALGGKIRIRYEGLGEPPAENFSAPKLYTADYQPPLDQEAC